MTKTKSFLKNKDFICSTSLRRICDEHSNAQKEDGMNNWAIQIIGIDGCGKSTIAKRLVNDLQNFTQKPDTILVHEPSQDTDISRDLYNIAFKSIKCTPVARELLLLASRSISSIDVSKHLETHNVISDRGFMCGYAYNKLKLAIPPNLWQEVSKECMNYTPDIFFYIEADKPRAIGRENKDDEEYDKMSESDRATVLDGYEEIIELTKRTTTVIRFKNNMDDGPDVGYKRFIDECLVPSYHRIGVTGLNNRKNKSLPNFIFSKIANDFE